MYLGIDLGTSNSAVVGYVSGKTQLFKAADGSDVLPSVIYLDRRGHRFIGKAAQDRLLAAPKNVASGFKRLMGTKSQIPIANESWSPEQCSSEIIRTLVSQAMTESGNQDIDGAVITILRRSIRCRTRRRSRQPGWPGWNGSASFRNLSQRPWRPSPTAS